MAWTSLCPPAGPDCVSVCGLLHWRNWSEMSASGRNWPPPLGRFRFSFFSLSLVVFVFHWLLAGDFRLFAGRRKWPQLAACCWLKTNSGRPPHQMDGHTHTHTDTHATGNFVGPGYLAALDCTPDISVRVASLVWRREELAWSRANICMSLSSCRLYEFPSVAVYINMPHVGPLVCLMANHDR